MLPDEERAQYESILIEYLHGQTGKVFHRFDEVMKLHEEGDGELLSTAKLLHSFFDFNSATGLVLPTELFIGLEEEKFDDINTIMVDMAWKDYPWFFGIAKVYRGMANIKLAIDLEGEAISPEVDRRLFKRLYTENIGRTEREKWISLIGENLPIITGPENSDYKAITQMEIRNKFFLVIDHFFPSNR